MRSPFLQIIYFEYYVSLSLVDEKIQAHRAVGVKKKMCTTFSVSIRGSCIDHDSVWGSSYG